jgi:hypothetical protein
MRFMVLVKADANSEAGILPSEEMLVKTGRFNEELVRDGVMLGGEGLHPSSKGARIDLTGAKPVVIDGPFAETKELLGGFWLVAANSLEEVIERFKRCPCGGTIEIRQVFSSEDFAPVIETDAGRAVLAAEDEFRNRTNR